MYLVRIISPNGIVRREHRVDIPPDSRGEAALLRGFTDHWIDICREDEQILEDEMQTWEDEDYFDCFDSIQGWLVCNGHWVPDYWKGEAT